MVAAGNKAKRLSSVNHTTKTIHHSDDKGPFSKEDIPQKIKLTILTGKTVFYSI